MIYIGFSRKTHKLYARILCKKFRHCAVFVIKKDICLMYQFIRPGKVVLIPMRKKDITTLKKYSWVFVKYNKKDLNHDNDKSLTCVQYTKHLCGIKNIMIQRPDGLFEYLTTK